MIELTLIDKRLISVNHEEISTIQQYPDYYVCEGPTYSIIACGIKMKNGDSFSVRESYTDIKNLIQDAKKRRAEDQRLTEKKLRGRLFWPSDNSEHTGGIIMRPTARAFKGHLREELQMNPKTSWGKNELSLYIEEVWADFIERYLED